MTYTAMSKSTFTLFPYIFFSEARSEEGEIRNVLFRHFPFLFSPNPRFPFLFFSFAAPIKRAALDGKARGKKEKGNG